MRIYKRESTPSPVPHEIQLTIGTWSLVTSSCRSYTTEDGEIIIPIGISVCGNIVIVVHHIRAIPIVKMAGRVSIK